MFTKCLMTQKDQLYVWMKCHINCLAKQENHCLHAVEIQKRKITNMYVMELAVYLPLLNLLAENIM